MQVGDGAAHGVDVAQGKVGAGFTQGEGDGDRAGDRARALAANDDGRGGGVGVDVQAQLVVAFDHLAAHCSGGAAVGVEVEVVGRVLELARSHANGGGGRAVGSGGEGGAVDQRVGAALLEVAQAAAADIDIGLGEVSAGLGQSEVNGLGAGDGTCPCTGDGDGGRRGVGRAGVDGKADLVVGVLCTSERIAVGVGVARHVGEFGGENAHAARAAGARRGREGGAVAGVACGGRARGQVGQQIADRPAHRVNVGAHEAAGVDGFAEGEGDALCPGDRATGTTGAGDDDGGSCAVGVEGGGDEVVGLDHTAADGVGAPAVSVQVLVTCCITESTCGNANGDGAAGVGGGGEGGAVGAARAAEVAERAARDHHIPSAEVAAVFAQAEGDGLGPGEGLGGLTVGPCNCH